MTNSEYGSWLAGGKPEAQSEGPNVAELQESVVLLRSTVEELSKSLAIANSEAEMFKRQSADLALQLDALGFADLDTNPGKLEARVLGAVKELRRVQETNDNLKIELVEILDALVTVLSSIENIPTELRAEIESKMRKANRALGAQDDVATARPIEATLTDAMIVDVKNDLSLVIINVGKNQQVHIGTPFLVQREKETIGSVLVVDVRDRICGAIIQNLVSENQTIQVGDRVRVDTRQ
ncbi:MAG: hypothetical protein ACK5LK_09885 [Chthoniobacterales bacterium]